MSEKRLVPDLRNLKFTVSLQQNDEIASFLGCSKRKIKFIKIESLLTNVWVGMVDWV